MAKFELDISDKLKTKVLNKVALNVVKIPISENYPLFFYGKASTSFINTKIELPFWCRNFILSFDDSLSANDKLYFTFDPNSISGYLKIEEVLQFNEIVEFKIIYLKSDSGQAEYRLWCW